MEWKALWAMDISLLMEFVTAVAPYLVSKILQYRVFTFSQLNTETYLFINVDRTIDAYSRINIPENIDISN